jgi:hypothetical protein
MEVVVTEWCPKKEIEDAKTAIVKNPRNIAQP